MDDTEDFCPEHVWRLIGASLGSGLAAVDYECTRCGAITVVDFHTPAD